MNLSAEYAPIYAHLDLHTLKKRALACLHTFVKDENIREQLVAAYTSPDRFDDLVQDLQEFVSLSGEGERRRFPKDSPMCQREALGIIAEFIKIPDVLSVVRSKEELQSDLKRLVHSPSEGVATYSAYILYQLNENANDNSFVPIPNQDVTDWDDSSINSRIELKLI
ncbi:Oidioi.mRNA.OKI2018_I69.XSR.g16918.t1.cds [Oikopleura dioica]|uniref:Oidioi.mRNA.OKI2018_I69.XSR.g16918.t1.cds n=1 Tax=Oikopleura dioica TaxID=34765 RepID=A0ABN7SLU3_OIKDI|nr:Oidioi.mRNA.OKI2018_I69.XSR.g16918.t1.cds [Oikopleura dioica]